MMALIETNAKKNEKGEYCCPKCEGFKFKRGMHLDATTYYINQYSCVDCGEIISTKHSRSKESQMYWGEDDD
jgi:NAD-dependent dihydropyrimidine dehydrogenase PreA subunit